MTTIEVLTLFSIILGPISAVLISLWIEQRRRTRDQKTLLLRLLISTRHLPSDPSFGAAINLIPIDFRTHSEVISAHKAFIEAASVRSTPETAPDVARNTATKTVRLIYEVGRALGYQIRETDIEYDAYSSTGWGEREHILQDSQKAARDLVNVLQLNLRVAAASPLTEDERAFLRLGPVAPAPTPTSNA